MNTKNLQIISNKIKDVSKRLSSEDMGRSPREDLHKRYKKTNIDKEESKEDYKDNYNDPDSKE